MFTGIVTDVGEVVATHDGGYIIACHYEPSTIKLGASIACDGVCLTVTALEPAANGANFNVDVSNETLDKTALGKWRPGTKVNLERPVCMGDELGGHVVTGHVDGVITIVDITSDDACRRMSFEAPEHLAMYVAPKGSIALDGTSLTVNEVSGTRFGVNIIPHTLTETTWGRKNVGDTINIEVDMFARYVARLMEFRR